MKSRTDAKTALMPDQNTLETMIGYSGEGDTAAFAYDLALFKALNAEYADKPVVPAPRPMAASYTTDVGRKRGEMLERKVGIRGQRVLEIGCGAGMMSRVLAREFECDMVGVDISSYPDWQNPAEGKLTQLVHDVSRADNSPLGTFDRVISFAVFEHVVHPHSALKAAYDMLKPGGKAYIYANLYRGAKASHRYREVFFPWAHLLFENAVWRAFYIELMGEPLEPAWVNKLTYDQYVAMAGRIGFEVKEHFPSAPFFDEAFYQRFETRLAAYPKYDLMHDFIHLVLEKPGEAVAVPPPTQNSAVKKVETSPLLDVPAARPGEDTGAFSARFWGEVARERPEWALYKTRWEASRTGGATPLRDGVPWMTFPAIDFLANWLRPDHAAFEWGMGGSTVLLRAHCKSVHSVEHDKEWFDRVANGFVAGDNNPETKLELIVPRVNDNPGTFGSGAKGLGGFDLEDYVRRIELHADASLDVVLVDGRARMACLAAAIAKVRPGGIILLDNANYPRYRKALDGLLGGALAGWQVIDLSGPGPYSRTPAWQTLLLRKPGGDVRETVQDADLKNKARPTADMRRAISDNGSRGFPEISYVNLRLSGAELASALSGAPYTCLGYAYTLKCPADWEPAQAPRSVQVMLHSWTHLEPFFHAYAADPDIKILKQLVGLVLDWLARFGAVPLEADPAQKIDTAGAQDFVAYDTAIADRFRRLGYLIHASAGNPAVNDTDFDCLIAAFRRHGEALAREEAFASQSNHGLLQAFAQLCGTYRFLDAQTLDVIAPELAFLAPMRQQASERLRALLAQQVGPDGVHLEHSPGYHVMMARALGSLVAHGLVEDAEILAAAARMREGSVWLHDAQGRIANFGDSDLEPIEPREAAAGEATPEPTGKRLFAEGYWVVRDEDSYLAQSACFHSRVHKQADSGSFIWRERGMDILIDAGRFGYLGRTPVEDPAFRQGYWYADARRRYVESSRAHNTVSVDGQDHPRYRTRPFGSAFSATAEAEGVFVSEVRLPHLPQMTHFRLLAYRPGEWLAVIDTLRTRDAAAHEARQHFHLHPDWKRVADRGEAMGFRHEGGARLYATPLFGTGAFADVARGKGKPEKDAAEKLSGWWSPAHMVFEPCTSFALAAHGEHVTLGTLFTFSPATLDVARTDFNATRRRFRLRWRAGGKNETLVMDRPAAGGLTLG